MRLDFTLNNRPCRAEAPAHWTVLDLLRDGLALTATKYGCGEGVCGTCTVLLDGEPVRACLVLASRLRGRTLLTAEGLEDNGKPDRLQSAFARAGAARRESPAHRARRARGPRRQSLPLYRLHEDHRSGAGRGSSPLMRLRPFALVEPETISEAIE